MKSKTILLILICSSIFNLHCYGQLKIISNNFISKIIPSSYIKEAGMDFPDELVFLPDEIKMSVNILPQNVENVIYNSWQIQVSKNDLDWNSDLELWIKRAGNGTSEYDIKTQNGEYYQKIEANNTFFFDGRGWIDAIPIQIKISGLSVTIPAKTYSTAILFTLIDN